MLPDGWREGKLSELISKLDAGVSVNSTDRMATPSEQGILKTSCVSNWFFDHRCNKAVTASEEIERLKEPVQANTILISRMNTPALVGASAYIDNDYSNLFVPDRLWQAKPKNSKVCMRWLATFLASDRGRYSLSALATGTSNSMKNITKPDVLSIKLLIPPPDEQEQIVEVISAWDNAIKKAEKLIVQKQKQKKALMQRLLTGKHRFPEFEGQKWKTYKLSDFLIPTFREIDKPSENYLAIGVRSHCKGTFQKPDSEPDKIAMEKLYVVKKDDLIVNITFAWEGAIALVKEEDEGGLVSHRFPTYTFKHDIAIPEFFKYAITTKRFRHILDLISPGGAGRNRVLSKKAFLEIEWRMPSIEEQQKIASVLNAADKEIDLLIQKLKAYQDQKKGLMQQLLTGKKRVNLTRKEAA